VQLQGRYDRIRKEGLGLVAISYDPPEVLSAFAASRGITFPLVSDPGSQIIRRYGILNETVDPKTRAWGVPHPGTFVLDGRGRVVARFFEDAYQERSTAASILAARGMDPDGRRLAATTAHLSMEAFVTDTTIAPGQRVSVVASVTPARGMHVYAPGEHGYQVVRLVIDPQPWLRAHETTYPPAERYHFAPLNETVNVYSRTFRLSADFTVLASPDAQKLLAGLESVRVTGALEYQACDDRICYNQARVPLTFDLAVRPLDRRPPR
jgi:hypothetical protein